MKRVFFRDSRWLDAPLSGCGKALDIGSGGRRRAGNVVTLDVRPLPETDVVHDVDVQPWPLADDTFDYVILGNVLEHVDDLVAFMRELHRVSAPGAMIRGVSPHFSNPCTFADPTHRHAFSVRMLEFFCDVRPMPAPCKWAERVLGCDIKTGDECLARLFRARRLSLYFRELLWPTLLPVWGNVFPDFYEMYVSRLFPAWSIYFELEVLKET